jgi:hypothetical protein
MKEEEEEMMIDLLLLLNYALDLVKKEPLKQQLLLLKMKLTWTINDDINVVF